MTDTITTADPAAVQTGPPRQLTTSEARKLTTKLRNALVLADNLLVQAYDEGAATALGYGTGLRGWKAYCERELPALRMLKIGRDERDAKIRLYRSQGLSEAAIVATGLAGAGTVNRALKGVEKPENLRSLDGKNRSAEAAPRTVTEAAPAPVRDWPPATPSYRRVADVVATAGVAGMTYREVADAIPWRDGQTSTALSKAGKRGLVRRVAERREGCTVWVAN